MIGDFFYRLHWAMLLFLIFACIETSMRLFPRKKSVATMLVCFHHSFWNNSDKFLLTDSAICRSPPPDASNIMSNGPGVNSAIIAQRGFWLFRGFFVPVITSLMYLISPCGVCWSPQAWDIGGHSQSCSKNKTKKLFYFYKSWKNYLKKVLNEKLLEIFL